MNQIYACHDGNLEHFFSEDYFFKLLRFADILTNAKNLPGCSFVKVCKEKYFRNQIVTYGKQKRFVQSSVGPNQACHT